MLRNICRQSAPAKQVAGVGIF